MSHQHSLPSDFTGTVCDGDFDILSFRYLRHKDGSIIRYRNFELSYEELLERRETLGYRDRSRTRGLSEKEFDLYPIRDVYQHPAALAYAQAHPRRTIPRFGPYLLLQTIGEGEFGKVKLGLHSQWGEEVAVKLIRRGSVDSTVRMSKVEREIDVLKTIRHPNIVRLYDVIETDKYIGIVLEYASGGELFDHILAHRCLKEKDASRLFAQLISGVCYIHAKKIVHRDLKLENLLLDRNRNVIISDFGFANRFEHRSDDLMQTSCGSPCYAAPELVISEGMYVGSAVDIWSCGVILYAMLAGYLPFDDDPANPDGDNINLLYKYIINTPLTFPDYISDDARDLLSKMLVPDPTRRADLDTIMNHHWLRTYRHFFDRTVEECEEAAVLQYEQKRQEYSRKLRARQPDEESSHRSRRAERATLADTSAPPSSFAGSAGVMSESALSAYANHSVDVDSAAAASTNSRRAQAVSAIVLPTQRRNERPDASMMSLDQDSVIVDVYPTKQPTHVPPPVAAEEPVSSKEKASNKRRQKAADRHTIQVEYDDPEAGRATSRPAMPMAAQDVFSPVERENGNGRAAPPVVDQQERVARSRMGSTPPVALSHAFASQHVDETPVLPPKTVSVTVTSPPPADPSPKRSNSVRTTGSKSRSRVSLGALGKVFNSPSPASPSVEEPQQAPKEQAPARAVSLSVSQHSQQSSSHGSRGQTATEDDQTSAQETTVTDAGDSSFAKMKRRTLNLVVGYVVAYGEEVVAPIEAGREARGGGRSGCYSHYEWRQQVHARACRVAGAHG
ncbi:Pkinase-domain-containing protein [Exidia glandulosa HHB12029]|uniref:Pkinase-domain-containing protein n=1 Tax=Exidia glandulosa HHB12029 TaxID=1314781 RepID=A0A165INP5_EXIGL|nr:Pkinase-domain-containing protein [Exidia glandulosa HHB12029]